MENNITEKLKDDWVNENGLLSNLSEIPKNVICYTGNDPDDSFHSF